MGNTPHRRRKYSEEELKELFGDDYQFPSDEELMRTPMVTLEEILCDFNKKYPPRKPDERPSSSQ